MRILANSLPKSGTKLLTWLSELLGYHESRLNLAGGSCAYPQEIW